MTLCRACGLTSGTDEYCERCGQPLRPGLPSMPQGAQPTLQMNPQPQTVRRVSLTGEVVETTQAMPTQHFVGPPPVQPGYGSTRPALPVQRLPPDATLPAGAYSPAALKEQLEAGGPSIGERWEKALAIAMPIVALSMLMVHFAPGALMGIVFGNLLVIPMVLGATGAIPRYEDAILDCSVMLVVAVLFGPLIALGAYLLTGLVKQECNAAIVTLLVLNVVIKMLFGVAFAPSVDTISLAVLWGFLNWMSFFGVCLSFLGWLLSGLFRDFDS